jgi:hypothetical protein
VTTKRNFGRARWIIVYAFLFALPVFGSPKPATLDDLKKLEIICFVPSYLPEGFKLGGVEITYDEPDPDKDKAGRYPLYSVEYENGRKATFSIDSAREGIGDRNLLGTDDADETEIQTPLGPMYLIYTPKGKNGRKIEIRANWVSDANMIAETKDDSLAHPILGRYHGFSAAGITVAEFARIVSSLHPINGRTP